ncbi:hypothetical protein CA267_001795 [Alteromonas pelagimontana]|uniref:Phage tail protein n=1 Tax=Alteromonas pelagimontana TaxID=1858656 RepID=A0A6M4MBU1_9ALTE|nr:phage tail protein [Alteromonas pelagimontana]QJR79616.1 hypothetical protein CA267_001795 [Alteromonas pelagimontana]
MQVSFKHDIASLTQDLKRIKESAIPKATVQALNRTATGVRTDAGKAISKETGIKVSDVRKELKVWKATKAKLKAEVNARTGSATNLIKFVTAANQKPNHFNSRRKLKSGKRGKYKAKGVKAKAWGKSKTYEGTFIGKGRTSGKLLVFTRTSDKRTPLKSVLGPSIRNTFDSQPMQKLLQKSASIRFNKDMAAAVKNQIRLATK